MPHGPAGTAVVANAATIPAGLLEARDIVTVPVFTEGRDTEQEVAAVLELTKQARERLRYCSQAEVLRISHRNSLFREGYSATLERETGIEPATFSLGS